LFLGVYTSFFCSTARSCWYAFAGNLKSRPDQAGESRERITPIFFPGSVVLGFDNDHAVRGYALVVHSQQTLLDCIGQRRRFYVKAQMNSRGNLVYILATGTLGTNCRDVDLILTNADLVADFNHTTL